MSQYSSYSLFDCDHRITFKRPFGEHIRGFPSFSGKMLNTWLFNSSSWKALTMSSSSQIFLFLLPTASPLPGPLWPLALRSSPSSSTASSSALWNLSSLARLWLFVSAVDWSWTQPSQGCFKRSMQHRVAGGKKLKTEKWTGSRKVSYKYLLPASIQDFTGYSKLNTQLAWSSNLLSSSAIWKPGIWTWSKIDTMFLQCPISFLHKCPNNYFHSSKSFLSQNTEMIYTQVLDFHFWTINVEKDDSRWLCWAGGTYIILLSC